MNTRTLEAIIKAEEIIRHEKVLNIAAEKAAREVGYRVYKLVTEPSATNPKGEEEEPSTDHSTAFRVFVLGDQGDGSAMQKKIAEAIAKRIEENPSLRPLFFILLGDNVYPFGISSPDDPAFDQTFNDIYLKHPSLAHIPFFVILGNHDENLHKACLPLMEKGIERGLHQVAITYRANTLEEIKARKALFEQTNLPVDSLGGWNMPAPFYSLIVDDTQFFFIDSNTYVNDYLNYLEQKKNNQPIDPNNQAFWLEQQSQQAKAQGRRVVLAGHHAQLTPGGREYNNSDYKLYFLKQADKERAENYFNILTKNPTDKHSYNELLRKTFEAQGLTFDLCLAGHDHNIVYNKSNEPSLCQLIVGTGGAELQKRKNFTHQDSMGIFLKRYGYAEIIFGNEIRFVIHTLDNENTIEFTHESKDPIRIYPDQQEKEIKTLCDTVKDAIDDYFSFLHVNQEQERGRFLSKLNPFHGNLSHGFSGAERAHRLWAYMSYKNADDFNTTLKNIYRLAQWKGKKVLGLRLTHPSENSLITFLNNRLKAVYEKNLNEMCKELQTQPDMLCESIDHVSELLDDSKWQPLAIKGALQKVRTTLVDYVSLLERLNQMPSTTCDKNELKNRNHRAYESMTETFTHFRNATASLDLHSRQLGDRLSTPVRQSLTSVQQNIMNYYQSQSQLISSLNFKENLLAQASAHEEVTQNNALFDDMNRYLTKRAKETHTGFMRLFGFSASDYEKRREDWVQILTGLSSGQLNKTQMIARLNESIRRFSHGSRHEYADILTALKTEIEKINDEADLTAQLPLEKMQSDLSLYSQQMRYSKTVKSYFNHSLFADPQKTFKTLSSAQQKLMDYKTLRTNAHADKFLTPSELHAQEYKMRK